MCEVNNDFVVELACQLKLQYFDLKTFGLKYKILI